jgi:hypothetical protein
VKIFAPSISRFIVACAFIFTVTPDLCLAQFANLNSFDKTTRLFLTGECHLKRDYSHMFSLFQQLHDSNHVCKIILEFPQELELGFNKYINDPSPDKQKYVEIFAAQLMKDEEGCEAFLEKMRLFNLSISDPRDKVFIVCPDVSRSIVSGLLTVLAATNLSDINNPEIDRCIGKIFKLRLRHFNDNQYKKAVVLVYELKDYMTTYESDFKAIYKTDFEAMKKKIDCLYLATLEYQTHTEISDSTRERLMFQYLTQEITAHPGLNYYGNLGLYHIMLNCSLEDITRGGLQVEKGLAQSLNEVPELKGKIVSMPYVYCRNDALRESCRWKISGKYPLEKEEEEKYALLSDDTAYYIVPSKKLVNSKSLEDKFQYLIISAR